MIHIYKSFIQVETHVQDDDNDDDEHRFMKDNSIEKIAPKFSFGHEAFDPLSFSKNLRLLSKHLFWFL